DVLWSLLVQRSFYIGIRQTLILCPHLSIRGEAWPLYDPTQIPKSATNEVVCLYLGFRQLRQQWLNLTWFCSSRFHFRTPAARRANCRSHVDSSRPLRLAASSSACFCSAEARNLITSPLTALGVPFFFDLTVRHTVARV